MKRQTRKEKIKEIAERLGYLVHTNDVTIPIPDTTLFYISPNKLYSVLEEAYEEGVQEGIDIGEDNIREQMY